MRKPERKRSARRAGGGIGAFWGPYYAAQAALFAVFLVLCGIALAKAGAFSLGFFA